MPATNRGQHPDIDTEGNVVWDAWLVSDPRERDFNRQLADPAERANFMARVEAFQGAQPGYVQESVGGMQWPGTAFEGFNEYLAEVRRAREVHAAIEGGEVYVDDADVDRMDLPTFDRHFDAAGRPRPGVIYKSTRGIKLDSGTDPASQREARRRS